MHRLLVLLLLPLSVGAFANPPTLCRPGETAYFDCAVGKAPKIASLCGRDDSGVRYLQYRFGRVGAAPELQVPAALDDPAMGTTFFFDAGRTRDLQVDSFSVWFRHVDVVYSLDYVQFHDESPPEAASIVLWDNELHWPPRSLACASVDGARPLADASDLIGAMSPPRRLWQIGPLDEARSAGMAKAASAAGAASTSKR